MSEKVLNRIGLRSIHSFNLLTSVCVFSDRRCVLGWDGEKSECNRGGHRE